MRKRQKSLGLLVIIGLMTVFLGCAATQTSESTGQYVDNSAITTKVKAAIFNDPMLKTMQISVESYKGRGSVKRFC